MESDRFTSARAESIRLRAQAAVLAESLHSTQKALEGKWNVYTQGLQPRRLRLIRFDRPPHQATVVARPSHTDPQAHAEADFAAGTASRHALAPVTNAGAAQRQHQALYGALKKVLPWVSLAQREALLNALPLRTVARRRSIANDEELRSHLYLLVSGVAKLGFVSSRANKRLIAVVSSGDFLGSLHCALGQRNDQDFPIESFYLEALTECLVAELDSVDMDSLIGDIDVHACLESIEHRADPWLRLLMWRMGVAELDVRSRVLANLVALAERFGVKNKEGVAIDLRLTETDLAQLIGASRPKVSICLTLLAREGLLIRDRRRLILTPKCRANRRPSD